jgi:hypothetical protein
MSNPSDRVLGTPPTNTPIPQCPDATSRRRFLTKAAGIAAGGTVLTLATVPPTPALAAPASPLDGINASPALRAAGRALRDVHKGLKEARAAFDATETLLEEWQRLNQAGRTPRTQAMGAPRTRVSVFRDNAALGGRERRGR